MPNIVVTYEGQTIAERTQQAFHQLARWIRWLAASSQIRHNWLMDAEDIVAECYFVLHRVSGKYAHKPYDEFIILAKVSMRNAVGSMRYKVGITHRKSEFGILSLDANYNPYDTEDNGLVLGDMIGEAYNTFSDDLSYKGINPEVYVERAEQFLEIAEQLDDFDLQVLDALLGNDSRVGRQLRLSISRKSFVHKNPLITITPLIVARAFREPVERVEESFERLKGMFQ